MYELYCNNIHEHLHVHVLNCETLTRTCTVVCGPYCETLALYM